MNTRERDPLAIGLAALGIMSQVGIWIWWGGRIEQRVATLEGSQPRLDSVQEKNAAQDVQIAIITTQYGQILTAIADLKAEIKRQ
jgi:hypothetical protein